MEQAKNMNFPKEQIDFLQSVQDMRQAQRDYYSQPSDYRLKLAKVKEAAVDRLLMPYINNGVVKIKQAESQNKLPSLFEV